MVRDKRFTFLKKDTVLLRNLPTESQKAKALRNFSPRPWSLQCHLGGSTFQCCRGWLISEASLPQRQPTALPGPGSAENY